MGGTDVIGRTLDLSMHDGFENLLAEQVGVRTGALEANYFAIHTVNQDPIGFDMKVAAGLTFALQWMVTEFAGKWLALQQQADHVPQLAHVVATLLRQLRIAFELPCIAGQAHQMPNCLNKSDALDA